jgi:hypothetical protein
MPPSSMSGHDLQREQVEGMLADARRFPRGTRRRSPAGRTRPAHAGPQQFDEAGFPVQQQLPSFTERVRKLLTG